MLKKEKAAPRCGCSGGFLNPELAVQKSAAKKGLRRPSDVGTACAALGLGPSRQGAHPDGPLPWRRTGCHQPCMEAREDVAKGQHRMRALLNRSVGSGQALGT